MRSHSKRVAPFWWTVDVALLVAMLGGSLTLSVRAQGETAKDAVFSAAQASRGEAVYQEQCSGCHSADLSGGDGPALAGGDFLGFWDETPMSDLVSKIQTTMPANSPGSLTREQSTDISAFILQVNEFPAGAADLPSDEATLKTVTITTAK